MMMMMVLSDVHFACFNVSVAIVVNLDADPQRRPTWWSAVLHPNRRRKKKYNIVQKNHWDQWFFVHFSPPPEGAQSVRGHAPFTLVNKLEIVGIICQRSEQMSPVTFLCCFHFSGAVCQELLLLLFFFLNMFLSLHFSSLYDRVKKNRSVLWTHERRCCET